MDEYKLVLKKAFEEVERRELSEIPEDDEIDWIPSLTFERKMNKLIKEQKRKGRKHSYRIGKRVAIVLIAAIITFICAMSVEASREAIIKFYKSVFQDGTMLSSYASPEDDSYVTEKIEHKYTVSNLPDSFVETYCWEDTRQVLTEWKDSNNKTDIYMLYQLTVFSTGGFDTESADMADKKINGYTVYTYTNKGLTYYIWNEKGYVFYLCVSNDADKAFVKSVIGKLEPAK